VSSSRQVCSSSRSRDTPVSRASGKRSSSRRSRIPRAIPIALGAVVLVYAAVLGAALLPIGPERIARSASPLAAAVEAGRWSQITPLVRAGAAVASAGVLLSLLAGVSRTALSMARRGDLPRFLAAVTRHTEHRTMPSWSPGRLLLLSSRRQTFAVPSDSVRSRC
jgi:amino acid transporter